MYMYCTCMLITVCIHVNSFKETRQSKQLRPKTTPFFSREKMSCLRRDSNPRRSAFQADVLPVRVHVYHSGIHAPTCITHVHAHAHVHAHVRVHVYHLHEYMHLHVHVLHMTHICILCTLHVGNRCIHVQN